MRGFFFDTADEEYIRRTWDKLVEYVDGYEVLGVTTNPNALNKIGCNTLNQLENTVHGLCELISEIRGKDTGGTIYVQMPQSLMENYEIYDWARYIVTLTDTYTNVGMKIPHFQYTLELSTELMDMGVDINVTGIADWANIIKSFAYPGVVYASIITGRMEEVGMDANHHLEMVRSVPRHRYFDQQVIAGSMRTIRGLQDAVDRGAIPTIGTRVWNQFDTFERFPYIWDLSREMEDRTFRSHPPLITEINRQLSVDFFAQMDKLGKSMYLEFINR